MLDSRILVRVFRQLANVCASPIRSEGWDHASSVPQQRWEEVWILLLKRKGNSLGMFETFLAGIRRLNPLTLNSIPLSFVARKRFYARTVQDRVVWRSDIAHAGDAV